MYNLKMIFVFILLFFVYLLFFFQAEDGIRDRSPSRGLGDVYKRQPDIVSQCMVAGPMVLLYFISIFLSGIFYKPKEDNDDEDDEDEGEDEE